MEDVGNDQMAELDAMKTVADALSAIVPESRRRVLAWAADAYGVELSGQRSTSKLTNPHADQTADIPAGFAEVGDLFAATSPSSDPDKALVVGYWLQYVENESELDAQRINTILKNLGHAASNITNALKSLQTRKPALAIQTKKSGSSQQARKKYKLTQAGKNVVESMISASQE